MHSIIQWYRPCHTENNIRTSNKYLQLRDGGIHHYAFQCSVITSTAILEGAQLGVQTIYTIETNFCVSYPPTRDTTLWRYGSSLCLPLLVQVQTTNAQIKPESSEIPCLEVRTDGQEPTLHCYMYSVIPTIAILQVGVQTSMKLIFVLARELWATGDHCMSRLLIVHSIAWLVHRSESKTLEEGTMGHHAYRRS